MIKNSNETSYRDQTDHPASWCPENNIVLHVSKPKEIVTIDLIHKPLIINDKSIDMVDYFGTIISDDLKSETNTDSIEKKKKKKKKKKV